MITSKVVHVIHCD